MTQLRTIIVDDESLSRELLRSYLEEMPEIEVVAECKNGQEAVATALYANADLLF